MDRTGRGPGGLPSARGEAMSSAHLLLAAGYVGGGATRDSLLALMASLLAAEGSAGMRPLR